VIVWGESDRMIPPVYGAAFEAGITGSRLISVPEAGHMIVLEKPNAAVEAVATLG
jgi:pimeloyl-ACP methyl ester carboxylesterase